MKKQIAKDKIDLNAELKLIGRFFILENFIDPDQKDNWIDLVTQLIEINPSVRDDIKEHILRNSSIRVKDHEKVSDSKNTSRVSSKHGSRRNSRAPSRSISRRNSKNFGQSFPQNTNKSVINPKKIEIKKIKNKKIKK